ncbi:MAG: hypothetical protein JW953_20780 [Anaerolineae bacterium]|nr:hypothetical protein [Anaerolineae bacterium]
MNTALTFLKRFFSQNMPRILLTGAEQTMRAWARRIYTLSEVPEVYREFFEPLPVFPYTVLTPSYEGFLARLNPKLVCTLANQIYVLEHRSNRLEVTCYPLAEINYIEAGTILLKSWLKISGVTPNGLVASSFQFSAVTQPFFYPIIEPARLISPSSNPPADLQVEREKFTYLLNLHFKFMNYARRSILPGEQVIASLLQPEIQTKVLALFNKTFYHTVSPAHLSILTDRELILIKEDPQKWTGSDTRYGGIWTYIPLNRITAVSLLERDSNTLTLTIHLPQNDAVSAIFALTNQPELEQFVAQLESMRHGLA